MIDRASAQPVVPVPTGRQVVATGANPWSGGNAPETKALKGRQVFANDMRPAVPSGLDDSVAARFHRLKPMATSCHHFVAKTPAPVPTGRHSPTLRGCF